MNLATSVLEMLLLDETSSTSNCESLLISSQPCGVILKTPLTFNFRSVEHAQRGDSVPVNACGREIELGQFWKFCQMLQAFVRDCGTRDVQKRDLLTA